MSAAQITGCSGAGKITIAAVLARRGLAAIDADDDPLLARSVDPAGNVVEEEPAEPDFAWLARHSWAWNPGRLDELIRAAAPATLYVCGGAAKELELADRFTHVFLLEIDEPTMLARIDARQDNDWGRIGDTREYLSGAGWRLRPPLNGRTCDEQGGCKQLCLQLLAGPEPTGPGGQLRLRNKPAAHHENLAAGRGGSDGYAPPPAVRQVAQPR
jgi:hypothetical protein